jgi:hypothetical protein
MLRRPHGNHQPACLYDCAVPTIANEIADTIATRLKNRFKQAHGTGIAFREMRPSERNQEGQSDLLRGNPGSTQQNLTQNR